MIAYLKTILLRCIKEEKNGDVTIKYEIRRPKILTTSFTEMIQIMNNCVRDFEKILYTW